ncbi:helix-turn-helix domain-containing protein [Candidatus Palauibacter sp.]|uniref:helix-turn-helix domain-containing protein n=1 Tax=Candidatus Palauibacter sp. TaxID=3101350 RepID=UPI003AF2E7AA
MSEKPTESGSEGLPKRWSAGRKAEIVLRLLRGEDLGEVSREIRVPPPELERWRRRFLEGAREGLKAKSAPDGALMRTRAKLGEMTMRVELQAELLEKRGYGDELRRLLRRSGG